ncbi:MAG: GntR family transcriptional regulator [Pirellulales bacterium]|nr:GntR family transcriptional regulator [Pirellulales bacterium]
MKIDPRSHVPIYLQIADGIREAVAAGIYSPGESLPSLRVLALDVQVNPNTVQRAYDELARDGLIYSRRGKGLFVAEQGKANALERARKTVRRLFDQGVQAGHSAGMDANDIRAVFQASMSAKEKQ